MNNKLIFLALEIILSPLCISSVIPPIHQIENDLCLSSSIGTAERIEFKPDISVNGKLYLSNPLSLKDFYPTCSDLYVYPHLDEYNFSLFTNKTGTQYLKASIYEGSLKHQYSLFEIGYLRNTPLLEKLDKKYNTKYDTLKTESGIALGMDLNEVFHIKGNEYKLLKTKSDTIITYRTEIGDSSGLCEKYNMPGYQLSLKIKNGKVNQIIYGFDYP